MTSVSNVEHLADSASGPSGCPRNREIPDSKVQKNAMRCDEMYQTRLDNKNE